MPKRSASAQSSPSANRKRSKLSADQTNIHQFFSSPGKKSSKPENPIITADPVEIINVDESEEEQYVSVLANTPSTSQLQPKEKQKKPQDDSIASTSHSDEPIEYDDLTQDPALYNPPSKPWATKSLPYSFLAHTLVTLTQTRSRIIITNTLTNALRTVILRDPTSLLSSLYLLSNTLSAPYIPIELGLGPSIISRSIQAVSGLTPAALKRLYNTTGDPGDVAFAAKSNLRTLIPHPPLLVNYVYSSLLKIAKCSGQGAAKEKQRIVEKLLLAATGEEVRFLTRTLSLNLRVGAVRSSILTALSRAMALIPASHFNHSIEGSYHVATSLLDEVKPLTSKGKAADPARAKVAIVYQAAENLVKRVYVQHPNYDHIVTALLKVGLNGLEDQVQLTIGVPLHPTLGSPTRSLEQVYNITGDRPFMAEFKYDGQRAQIHASRKNGTPDVSIFSRHLEDMTAKYPDVTALVNLIFERNPDLQSFILDAEIVAIDSAGNVKTFQELSNRPRKDVQLKDIQVSVCVFIFDLMYLNGEILLGHPFRNRRDSLHQSFPPFIPVDPRMARLDHVESCGSEGGQDAIETFWEKAIESRCEGLMIKLLDSDTGSSTSVENASSRRKQLPATYEPDKRTSAWLKLKRDYVSGLGDTLDLIPIGAWHGNGRKAGWWSPILLGLWQPESGRIVAVCKCMSGFTDAFYKDLAERYQLSEGSDVCSKRPLWECDVGGLSPEVFFKPQEVWEIRGADITISPVSIAAKGLVADNRGLSIRFPRFLRVRDDKSVEQASTPRFLAHMWRTQQQVQEAGADDGELVDPEDEGSDAEVESDESLD